jgi:hypothetical protein
MEVLMAGSIKSAVSTYLLIRWGWPLGAETCSEWRKIKKGELTYWNFVAIDGIIRNQLDRCATGCNTQRKKKKYQMTLTSHLHSWQMSDWNARKTVAYRYREGRDLVKVSHHRKQWFSTKQHIACICTITHNLQHGETARLQEKQTQQWTQHNTFRASHLIHFNSINTRIFREENTSRHSSLCDFLLPPVIQSFLK